MYYLYDTKQNKIIGIYGSYAEAKNASSDTSRILIEENAVKYISRICYCDDECIYNNIDFWTIRKSDYIDDFTNHTFTDFVGSPVSFDRFNEECVSNAKRISQIDGQSGQIEYNMEVGNEFISLFREECINTEFDYSTGVSPLTIWAKMEHVQIPKSVFTHNTADTGFIDVNIISMINAGCFREAAQALNFVEPDIYLTEERIAKYMAMLNSADAITYSTDPKYYYDSTPIAG